MKEFAKFIAPLILALGVLILVLGFLSSDAEAQNPTGDRTWPLWTKPGRTSVIIVNIHATEKATICPKDVPDADGGACSSTNGLELPAGAAVTLDRSVLAAPSGFLCFGNNTTIRYWAEQ